MNPSDDKAEPHPNLIGEPKMCPFCGSDGHIARQQDTDRHGKGTGFWRAWVMCMNGGCDARGPTVGEEGEDAASTKAREAWDDRRYAHREWNRSPD